MVKNKIGKFVLSVPREQASQALDILVNRSLTYERLWFSKDGELHLLVHASQREEYVRALDEAKINYTIGANKGVAVWLLKYSKRWGLFAGLLILLVGVSLSSLFVWKIEVDGNTSVSDKEILNILSECGLTAGTYIPSINYDALHNKFLKSSDNIAWISVNIDGNVAKVKVKERMKEDKPSGTSYTNVTAKCDGQIILINVLDGVKSVKISDVVKKGDVLISGVIDSGAEGVRYVHADGIVNAYVTKNLTVKIPMREKVKVYTGDIYTDKSVKVFAKNINIFKKYRNYNILCDKIETSEYLKLFNGKELPIEITDTMYLEYVFKDVEYSQREAKDIASAKLREIMDKELADAILISQSVKHYCDFEYYYIECQLYCIENIAQLTEFEVIEK